MYSKGFYIFGSLVILLSLLIIFFDNIPYVKYKDRYIALSHVEIEHNKTLELEKAAFDLAIEKNDIDVLEAIYYHRLSAEKSSKDVVVKGLDVSKSLAQLIIIITVSFMLIGVAKQREYNKKIKRDC